MIIKTKSLIFSVESMTFFEMFGGRVPLPGRVKKWLSIPL